MELGACIFLGIIVVLVIYWKIQEFIELKNRKDKCTVKIRATIVEYRFESHAVGDGDYYAVYTYVYNNQMYTVQSKNRWHGFRRKGKKVSIMIVPTMPNIIYDRNVCRAGRTIKLVLLILAVIYLLLSK